MNEKNKKIWSYKSKAAEEEHFNAAMMLHCRNAFSI